MSAKKTTTPIPTKIKVEALVDELLHKKLRKIAKREDLSMREIVKRMVKHGVMHDEVRSKSLEGIDITV